ncbi:MAG: arginine--tRNA ligase [Candidatus Magasanikbacteria bacterium]|nr:arginine--tRNA ligase [Candidatus Magasanikbacteria bacterium]
MVKRLLVRILRDAGVEGDIELSAPPKLEMGDFAFACFDIAKKQGKNPNEAAAKLAEKLRSQAEEFLSEVNATGPYVNFVVEGKKAAEFLLPELCRGDFGRLDSGRGKTVLVEYACPNPMKVFHLGHLRNLVTGEAVARVFENALYDVKRVNYQGDVGMHIAKSLWGIERMKDEFDKVKKADLKEKVAFLGRAYAFGAGAFEQDESAKQEILEYNKKIYEQDAQIAGHYQEARSWSLDYFDEIYKKLGSHFDRLYFESEVFGPGKRLVEKGVKKDIFKKSQGALIFAGSEIGLHDRVFVNSKGFPTYEGKDMGLAELHIAEYHPDLIIHVVGKEQSDYFKVVFKALEQVLPETKGKEHHLVGGYLQLRGDQKMSSRTGKVVAGDELIAMVESKVEEIMHESNLEDKKQIALKVAVAALKYSMLKVGVSQDIAFDITESVAVSGDSGPYLLYIVARIKSILRKAGEPSASISVPDSVEAAEKKLLLRLSFFTEATERALISYDPSVIAKYLYALAQDFNVFYEQCSVLESQGGVRAFRLKLLEVTRVIMERGLSLLGIETVEQM